MSTAAASAPIAAPAPSAPPRLAPSCSFHPYDNGGGAVEYLLAVGDGRQFKIPALAHRLLTALDGETPLERLSADLRSEGFEIAPAEIERVVGRYAAVGAIARPTPDAPNAPSGTPAPFRSRFPLWAVGTLLPPRPVAALARALRPLYRPALALPLLALIAWSHALVYSRELRVATLLPESYLAIVALVLGSMLFHELGHAAALSRFGGAPGGIGFGLYLLMPTFFAEVSQLWRFPRRRRMVVDLGGAYFQQIAFAAFALAAARTGRMELLAACRMIDVLVLVALNPVFRFDGYWFLADYLAMPKLHGIALRYPLWRLRRRLGLPAPPLALPPLGRLARAVFVSYSFLASAFLLFAFWLSYRYLTQALTQFPAAAARAWGAAGAALAAGEPALFAARLLAAFFLVAVPATVLLAVALALAACGRWAGRAISLRGAALRGARRSA